MKADELLGYCLLGLGIWAICCLFLWDCSLQWRYLPIIKETLKQSMLSRIEDMIFWAFEQDGGKEALRKLIENMILYGML